MHFMNEWDIQQAVEMHAKHPILGRATRLLAALKDLVNGCSDGWAYWKAPVQAADKLMTLIENGRYRPLATRDETPPPPTEEDFKNLSVIRFNHVLAQLDKVGEEVARESHADTATILGCTILGCDGWEVVFEVDKDKAEALPCPHAPPSPAYRQVLGE